MRSRRVSRVAGGVMALALAAGGCAAGNRLASRTGDPAPAPGAALLARRCESCHARPDPSAMPRQRWLDALARMQKRIVLPAAEWDSLASLAASEASGAGASR